MALSTRRVRRPVPRGVGRGLKTDRTDRLSRPAAVILCPLVSGDSGHLVTGPWSLWRAGIPQCALTTEKDPGQTGRSGDPRTAHHAIGIREKRRRDPSRFYHLPRRNVISVRALIAKAR